MSTALCPPHKTVHSAIIRISNRSCRPALPVRGSSSPSKQAMNLSMSRLPPTASKTPWVDSIASQHASLNALVKLFQMRSPWIRRSVVKTVKVAEVPSRRLVRVVPAGDLKRPAPRAVDIKTGAHGGLRNKRVGYQGLL